MTIQIECLNVIVPVKVIEAKFKGGLAAFNDIFGNPWSTWTDGELFRLGAMNPMDVATILGALEHGGLKGTLVHNEKEIWRDFCVVDSCSGPTLPCEWIGINSKASKAWLKGKYRGEKNGIEKT